MPSDPSRTSAHVRRLRLAGAAAVLLYLAAAVSLALHPAESAASQRRPATPFSGQSSDSVLIYAPTKVIHDANPGIWTISDDVFAADTLSGWRYLVEIVNGSPAVSAALIDVGGQQFVGSSQFGSSTNQLVQPLDVAAGINDLAVELQGPLNSWVSVRVVRVKDPTYKVFGRKTYVRPDTIAAQTDTLRIPVNAAHPYTLHAINGLPNADSRLTNATVSVNNSPVMTSADFGAGVAQVQRDVSLHSPTQPDTITLLNQSAAGTRVTLWTTVTDSTRPRLALTWPTADTTYISTTTMTVSGSVTDSVAGLVSINGTNMATTPGPFQATLPSATDGRYPLLVYAISSSGLDTTVTRMVFRDSLAPTLTLASPAHDTTTGINTDSLTLVGSWVDSTRTVITVDGDTVGIGYSGGFSRKVALDGGPNGIFVAATDMLGHLTSLKRLIWRTPSGQSAPRDTSTKGVTAGVATEVSSFRNQVGFIFRGANPVQTGADTTKITNGNESVIRGIVVARDFGILPNVVVSVLNHPEFGTTKTLSDGWFDMAVAGSATYVLRFALPNFLEAQRQVDAPALDFAVLDTIALIGRSARWYYADTALAQTVTGRFEADSNGARRMYLLVPNGALATVTPATGSPVNFNRYRIKLKEFTVGSSGRASMPGQLPPTTAYTYCVDMSLAEADSIADAQGSGPPDIVFSKPIVTYVKEFLGFPVGTHVPSGYYDPRTGKWVADENGHIIKVLSTTGGLASLDTDGDGQPDTLSQYVAMSIDTLERTRMATLFKSGDLLWRMRVTHFSPHDFNYNQGDTGDETAPTAANAGAGSTSTNNPTPTCGCVIENENRVLGETIPLLGTPQTLNYRSNRQYGDQAMRWIRIPLTGAVVPPGILQAHVTVDVAGRHFAYALGSPGANAVFMFKDWNGNDAYGRRVPGSVTATVKVGFEYKATYAVKNSGNRDFNNSSAVPTASGLLATGDRDGKRIDWNTQKVSVGAPSMASAGLGGWTLSAHHFYDTNGRGTLYFGDGNVRLGFRQFPTIKVFAGDGQVSSSAPSGQFRTSLSISPGEMAFGPDGSLYFIGGVGTGPSAGKIVGRIYPDGTMTTWAGCPTCDTGDPTNYPVNGLRATDRRLAAPSSIAVGLDGSVYVADPGWRQVFKILPNDTIYVVSGSYPLGYGTFVDGAVAATQALSNPFAVAAGPDGSVYIADTGTGYRRVVRVSPDGIMRSFAGNGDVTPVGTSGKADSLAIPDEIGDVAVDPAGNVYFTEPGHDRIRLVSPNGRMTSITSIDHGPRYLTVGVDGALYIGQSISFNGLYRRETDGSISVIAGGYGSGANKSFGLEEGGSARAAVLTYLVGIAQGPDGSLYTSESPGAIYQGNGIRRISTELPGTSAGEIAYPSADGHELYFFTQTGRHLRTRDATTGLLRYTFGYDNAGRLTSVVDANGDSTKVLRVAGTGVPTSVVGPYGQHNDLTLDANGYLQQVRNPLTVDTYNLTSSSDGLLATHTNPRGKQQSFAYNPDDGRLYTDTDPANATQTLTHSELDVTQNVSRSTQMGRVTAYQVTQMIDGLRRRLISYPSHAYTYSADSINSATTPYGEVIRDVGTAGEVTLTYPVRDKRYGMLAQVPANVYTTLPSGLTRHLAASRDSTAGVITETQAINDNVFTTTYNVSSKVVTNTSPQGRTSTATLDGAGRPTSVTVGSNIAPIALTYDTHGRLTLLRQGGRAWRYSYDSKGRLQVVRDTLQRMTTYAYDNADRATSQLLPGNRTVGYGYDANGNLTSLTPPGSSAHTFGYTAVDLDSAYTPPAVPGISTPTTRYDFNPDRQLTQVTRPDGKLVHAAYNASTGQLDSLTQARGRNAFTYAANGQLLTASSPDNVTLTYGYDGPLLRAESWSGLRPGGVADSASTRVNNSFQDSVQTIEGSSPVTYGYDTDGLLTSVAVNGATEAISRRGDGLISTTSVGSVTSTLSYNSHGELWKLSYAWPGNGSFQQVLDRDSLGRVVKITETGFIANVQQVTTYRYNTAGQLDSLALNGVKVGYTYSLNGNRVARRGANNGDTTTATYDAQDRMIRYGKGRYSYTDAGELTKRVVLAGDTLRTTYDALGNLTGVHLKTGDSLVYLIDGANRRVARVLNGQRTATWLYGNALNVAAQEDSTGAVVLRYAYGTQGHVPDLLVKGGVTYRLITDQLGSVRAVVNISSGAKAQRTDYDAWGVRTKDSLGTFQPLGYAGGLTDSLTALVRFGARDYDPGVGRWTSKDPMLFMGEQTNLSSYCSGDPLNRVDPGGELYGGLIPAGESFADSAMLWYANQLADPNRSGYWDVPLWVGGSLASLWSSCNSTKTLTTLEIAYLIRVFGPFTREGVPDWLDRLRKFIRIDPPHHGKEWELDGKIPQAIRKWFER